MDAAPASGYRVLITKRAGSHLNLVPKMPTERVLAAVVGDLAVPACIFDVETYELLAANEAGHQLWGSDIGQPPFMIDSAMPGLARLRNLASTAVTEETGPETLTFWTRHGLLSRPCICRRVSLQPSRAAVLVTWPTTTVPARSLAGATTGDRALDPAAHLVHESAPADVATLRQIARRIRERPKPDEKDADHGSHDRTTAVDTCPPSAALDQNEHDRNVFAKLSHELRTPLAAVIALAEIMTEEHLGPLPNVRYRGYIRDIRDSARHALAVVDGMLERRNITTGQIEFVFAEIDLNDTADACVATIRPLADKAGLTLSTALAEGLPKVIADRRCLKQILLNLLSNSVKYAGAGAEVSVRSGYELAGSVWIEVADTGPGIPAEVVARTLSASNSPLSVSEDILSAEGRRVGLGLPISRQLARANGARLELDCASETGTRVRISFAKDRAIPV